MNEEAKVKKLFHNPKFGLLYMPKLWQRMKQQGIKVSYNDMKIIIEQEETYQIHKQVKNPKEFSNVEAYHPFQCTQADIMVYDRFQLHKYKYVLGVIDVYSRFVSCRSLTNMRVSTILDAFHSIFKEFGQYP